MTNQTIVLGGGCFWCTEAVFQMLRGVVSVQSGYAGGTQPNPTYQQVSSSTTGHAEVIQVTYDPAVIGLKEILSVFFSSHDPTTLNQQGNDTGPQYRSVIFYTTPEQQTFAQGFINELSASKTFDEPIVTSVESLQTFYPAEEYHQNYYQSNQSQPYCQLVINPKITKLKKNFAHLLK